MDTRLIEWFINGDTGLSSMSIVAFMEGVNPRKQYTYPADAVDLERCIKLLFIMPEYLQRLDEMKAISPIWRNLIDNWFEISALRHHSPQNCNIRMAELIRSGQYEILDRPYPK